MMRITNANDYTQFIYARVYQIITNIAVTYDYKMK